MKSLRQYHGWYLQLDKICTKVVKHLILFVEVAYKKCAKFRAYLQIANEKLGVHLPGESPVMWPQRRPIRKHDKIMLGTGTQRRVPYNRIQTMQSCKNGVFSIWGLTTPLCAIIFIEKLAIVNDAGDRTLTLCFEEQ